MGEWLSKHGQSIYGTRGGPFHPTKSVASTRKENKVYLHVFNWETDSITLPSLPQKIVSSRLLTGGKVTVNQRGEALTVIVPKSQQEQIDTIIELELNGPVMSIEPIRVR
jgi:alpha-L-fucosidase